MTTVQAKQGNVRIMLSVKESTRNTLRDKAGGERKIGAFIDQMVEEKFGKGEQIC